MKDYMYMYSNLKTKKTLAICHASNIELYYPKVKIGGIIGGHDFDITPHHIGVPKAVIEFIENNNIKSATNRHGDWFITKMSD